MPCSRYKKAVTSSILARAHVANIEGASLTDLARAYNVNYGELSKGLKAWRAERLLVGPLTDKALRTAVDDMVGKKGRWNNHGWLATTKK